VSYIQLVIKEYSPDDLPDAYRAEARKRGRLVGEAKQEDGWVWCGAGGL
jgi:hypothetical protein